jgi:hypothetical protein
MTYRGASSDERLRAARAADQEREQLTRVLAHLATALEAEESRETEHEELLAQRLSTEERALVVLAHQEIAASCSELRGQIARLQMRRDALAAPARDLADARAERIATIANTPNGKAALELIGHLGDLDALSRSIGEAIQTGTQLGEMILEHLLADGVTPSEVRDAHESRTVSMKRWLSSVRGAIGHTRADLAMFRSQLASLGIVFDPSLPRVPDWNPAWLAIGPSMEVVSNLWGSISGLSTDVATQVGLLRKRAADLAAEVLAVEDECDRLLLS